ncbi:hypothetical protein [Holdemanella biformis]
MTPYEFDEINSKYNLSVKFNSTYNFMPKEIYEDIIKSSIKEIENILNDDSNEEDLMTYKQEIKTLEKALDKACKYTHNNGLNGCPANFDIGAVDKKKKKECILCKFHCGSEKYFFNKEYENKSKECWKEYFLKGARK